MSEQTTDAPTEEDMEAARRGQALALMMIAAIDGQTATVGAMLNALGNLVVPTFCGLDMCDHHTIEEFDRWCAYTRERIVADQRGEGETRQ